MKIDLSKTYVTRYHGWVVTGLAMDGAYPFTLTGLVSPLDGESYTDSWTEEGRYVLEGWDHEFDLMPTEIILEY